jgi:diguanylate cyclase (GGDEF)-like protein
VIIFTIVVILAEIVTIYVNEGNTVLRSFNIFSNVIGFALTPVIPIALITIFDRNILQKHKLLVLPTLLNFLTVILSPFFGLIFYIDLNNYYQRGSFFGFFVVVYIINIIFLLFSTLYTCQKYFYPIKWKIVSLTLFTVTGTCIQLLFPTIFSTWHCVTFSLFLFYILLLEFEGSFDTMTELFNRAAFDKSTTNLKCNNNFSVVIMDINNFKEINDNFGHEYGDTVLKEVAMIIRNAFDKNCSCYRIGGDELCVICRYANKDKLENQLMDIKKNLAKERLKDRSLPSVAYGYSIFEGEKTLDFKKEFKEADKQMYNCKQQQKEQGILDK